MLALPAGVASFSDDKAVTPLVMVFAAVRLPTMIVQENPLSFSLLFSCGRNRVSLGFHCHS